jgi:predicted CxxxxCH...CXXCH cytochrome family protein
VSMSSNGHSRLVGKQWIRQYPCYYCHNATADASSSLKDLSKHINRTKDVEMSSEWAVVGKPAPSYDPLTKVCNNVYCHTDGTTGIDSNRAYSWTQGRTECNSCHGHPRGTCQNSGCHDGRTDTNGVFWEIKTGWLPGDEWKAAMPMYPNGGPGTARANSHPRHMQSNFSCAECHAATIKNGECITCHASLSGNMGEVAHIDPATHVNRQKDVVFKQGGSYNPVTKSCSNTACHHSGTDPVWGGSLSESTDCYNCHGVVGPDLDDFGKQNGIQAKISLIEWTTSGHGRPAGSGPYPISGNPPANFPANPCWYCHDPNVLHKDAANPFRLRQHAQFSQRFDKECVYCHMEGRDEECLGCHNAAESLAPQLAAIYPPAFSQDHRGYVGGGTSCVAVCHATDATRHKTGAGIWTSGQKADVRNQYMMMGVCLQCHDDDSGGRCTSCHSNSAKYSLGFDPLLPGTGFIKPQKARASSVHFGHKHYAGYQQTGIWKGGKFCWDCHDPHGDANIYMIQTQVATTTDGTFGIPQTRAQVSFSKKQSGMDYARVNAPYNGICNVCHTAGSQHYRVDGGDGHNSSRVCTGCHEHRFTDSHADKQACNTCHQNKPVPRHSAFGLPRDCTKCHGGIIGKRTDVMGQFKANSHHVQGVEVTNKQCYACHWEATSLGLIDVRYHKGYNQLTYSSVKNAPAELVIWGAGSRPTVYKLYSTAVEFQATNMGTANERSEVAKLTLVCTGCHSDQNNNTQPFKNTTSCNSDYRTPRHYSWDKSSVASRYLQKGTAAWGKYNSTTYATSKKDTVVKAFSAHGNAAANQGGWSAATGYDGAIPVTRGGSGAKNVECFDCHNSHGSKVSGVTSSYLTFNGSNNGANLKETQAGKGGYGVTYMAQANPSGVNRYAAGAGQCFDCHETAMAGVTPWGYNGTYGASGPIMGYKDTSRFGQGVKGSTARFGYRDSRKTIVGGHLQASSFLKYSASRKINGLCTPCHDPHGVSPALGANQAYAVPLLKGTWLTSPYAEDRPAPDPSGNSVSGDASGTPRSWGIQYSPPDPTQPTTNYNLDRTTFGGATRISEDESQFAGLCLSCHRKENLNSVRGSQFKTTERVHEAVKGWGNNREHSYSCSKCHQPHNSGLPRLMQTNCLNFNHRGERSGGGQAWSADSQNINAHEKGDQHRGYPIGSTLGNSSAAEATGSCHGAAVNNPGSWPTINLWNNVTPW